MSARGDVWREDFTCYASQWGYRCDSQVGKLINHVREESRIKYGCDYRLVKIGKNRYRIVAGEHGSSELEDVIAAAANFDTTIVQEKP